MGELSDSERDQYVKELTRHCGDGRITLDELEERVGEVYAATTRAELRHALRELPRFHPVPDPEPAPVRTERPRRRPPSALAAAAAVPAAATRRTRPPAAHRRGGLCVAKPPAILLSLAIVMLITAHWVFAAILFAIAVPKLNRAYRFS